MKARSRIAIVLAVAAGLAVLCSLGWWQVQRLHWKQALIAEVTARIKSPPRALQDVVDAYARGGDVDYMPVTLSGRFDHSAELYYFTTNEGQSGWDVFTPMALDGGRTIIVNRGFVPATMRDPATRREGQVEGVVEVEGLARNPLTEKPNPLIPDNQPEKRQFFWRSLGEMAAAAGVEPDAMLPIYVDAGATPNPGGWPRGGTTIVSFPNNHLGYAITWFGLAAALLAVGVAFLLRGGRTAPAADRQP